MATTYNIVEKRYNGTDYDTLYPATKGENLVSAVPLELGGTGGTTGAAGMKNLLDALSTVTPTGTDLLPLKDVSGNIAGKATVDSILSLVSGGAKIQTGSYVGTGTYGQANPCSLTFDFEPKLLLFTIYYRSETDQSIQELGFIDPNAAGINNSVYSYYYHSTGAATITIAVSGTTLSWYGDDASRQRNDSGIRYYYVCFG